jgi:hypothetical protein
LLVDHSQYKPNIQNTEKSYCAENLTTGLSAAPLVYGPSKLLYVDLGIYDAFFQSILVIQVYSTAQIIYKAQLQEKEINR